MLSCFAGGAGLSALATAAPQTHAVVSRTAEAIQRAKRSTAQESKDALFLPAPARAAGRAFVILVPGANRDAQEYVALAQELQARSEASLAVAIVRFTRNFPNPVELPNRVDAALALARSHDAGWSSLSSRETLLVGHSLGGIFGKDAALSKNLGGLVLLGSYLPGADAHLRSYPLPVLTLAAELDGLTRLTRVAREYAEMTELGSDRLSKPVVAVAGANHSQMASGVLQKRDLRATLSAYDARARFADIMAAFLSVNLSGAQATSAARAEGRRVLEEAMMDSEPLFRPFLAALDEDTTLCARAQEEVVHPRDEDRARMRIDAQEDKNAAAFAFSKPALVPPEGDTAARLTVRWLGTRFANPLDHTLVGEGRKEIACKMKSQEALLQAIAAQPAGPEASCAAVNARTFARALEAVGEAARARYLAQGRPLAFLDDKAVESGVAWLPAGLAFDASEETREATVQSPTLRTALSAPDRYAGMAYCKLLPPSRATEWILVDGLR